MGRGAWWATVHGVTWSRTQLKPLSTLVCRRAEPWKVRPRGCSSSVVTGTSGDTGHPARRCPSPPKPLSVLSRDCGQPGSPHGGGPLKRLHALSLLVLPFSPNSALAPCRIPEPKRACRAPSWPAGGVHPSRVLSCQDRVRSGPRGP